MIYFWVIIAYLIILIGVGAYRSKYVKTQDDFMVAGRKLSAKVLVGTLLATWIGSGSIIASAGLAYDRGLPALWFDAGVWAALIILYLIAGRARKFGQYTVPDILEARFNKYARLLGTIVTIIAYTAIVSYQFRAGGMVLNLITGIPVEEGIIITAIFVIGYTVLAGLISVAYTDVVNGVIMIIGLFIALPFLLNNAGGWEGVMNNLPETHFSVLGDMTVRKALSYSLPTMLLLLGESGMYQRFFSARDERTAKRSVVGWIIGTVIIETLIVFLAVIGSSVFKGIDSESVILYSVKEALPILIGCLCLSAIVAVIVSTADSFLLVPATNIMRDIYQRFVNPDLPQKKMVLYSRIVVVFLGLIAYLQVQFFEKVLEMAIYAYTMYGVGITPAVMAAFFWKRATPAGGVCSIAAGMIITILWEVAGQPWGLETIYPALGLSLFCLIFVSYATSPPDKAKWQPFF
ncbi:MAG: sodium:solute symporter family protein [Candidatus Zixiibacteriota bacterium]|nr:MAG: sodium:solute symporter family protein [candidate division Zixibacteria bacterium]